VQEDVIGRTREALSNAGALRPPRGEGDGAADGGERDSGDSPSESTATVSNR
jgi:hypothetical protein